MEIHNDHKKQVITKASSLTTNGLNPTPSTMTKNNLEKKFERIMEVLEYWDIPHK